MKRLTMLKRAEERAREKVSSSSALGDKEYAELSALGNDDEAVNTLAKRFLQSALDDFDEL